MCCSQDRLNSERRVPALETTPSMASTTNSEIQNLKEMREICVAVLPHYFLVFSIIFPTKLWQYHGVASILRHQIDQFGSGVINVSHLTFFGFLDHLKVAV